ncbi:TPA_asm: P overlapped [Oak alphacytorhabdovirus 1]|nr:TPA_asm: P overlapped [Oak alphacytorhabdovirus 1]
MNIFVKIVLHFYFAAKSISGLTWLILTSRITPLPIRLWCLVMFCSQMAQIVKMSWQSLRLCWLFLKLLKMCLSCQTGKLLTMLLICCLSLKLLVRRWGSTSRRE